MGLTPILANSSARDSICGVTSMSITASGFHPLMTLLRSISAFAVFSKSSTADQTRASFPFSYGLLDVELGFSLQPDKQLTLIVKWAVEAADIEINQCDC
jgi:hypothetical protein